MPIGKWSEKPSSSTGLPMPPNGLGRLYLPVKVPKRLDKRFETTNL